MDTAFVTTTLLLERLLDPEDEFIWREFDKRYSPIVMGLARRLGLSEPDAVDVSQEAMARFVRFYREGKYDRDKAQLRTWLCAIVRNCIRDLMKVRSRRRETRGDSLLGQLEDSQAIDRCWDEEEAVARQQTALERLRNESGVQEKTIQAFELLMFWDVPVEEVAQQCEMSVSSVYTAKHRCLTRLREIVGELEAAYDA